MSRAKSDLYKLMARKEIAGTASVLTETARLSRSHQTAEQLSDKLRSLLDERRPQGVLLASQLRTEQILSSKIAYEATKNTERTRELAQELAEARGELARREHKTRLLHDAARSARAAEDDEREARTASSAPFIRRR